MSSGDERTEVTARINHLIDEYRIRCLWFMRLDYFPTTDAERARLLEYIERHGDREGVSARARVEAMALTTLQRTICRLIARNRISSGESYVAGGAALNELAFADRLSHDIDLFHDTEAALQFHAGRIRGALPTVRH